MLFLVASLPFAGCGPSGDEAPATGDTADPPAAGEDPDALETELRLDDLRLGRQVDPDGSVPVAKQGDEFAPGESVYVSMSVADAPAAAAVHVVFYDQAGGRVAEDEKKVPAQARYLYFDSGDTTSWPPGEYRVEVAVDGETVDELHFTLTGDTLASAA